MYRKKKNRKDILYILKNLREEDKHEAITQMGENYIKVCLKNLMKSKDEIIIGCKKSDNTPVCMGGVAKTSEKGVGVVWLLSTPDIVNHQICLLKNLKKEFEKIENEYWLTYNMIYKENSLTKKWLTKFGYKFENIFGLKIPKDFEFFYRKRKLRGLK